MKTMLYRLFKRSADLGVRALRQLTPDWTSNTGQLVLPLELPVHLPPPRNADELPEVYLTQLRTTVVRNERRLYLLHNVFVSWHGVVFRNLRLFIPSAQPGLIKEFSGSFLLRQWNRSRLPISLAANEVVGLAHVNYAVGNYYHWLIDSLPRLVLLQRHYPGCQLLLPAPIPGYVQQTALMFGFERLLPLEVGDIASVPQLVMPDYVAEPGSQDAALIKEVRETILGALNLLSSPPGSRRIFVSRNQQPIRRLLNSEAIEPILHQYGFETVSFEGMPFADQVRTMREAAVLVGVHGANLTNMLFMAPQAIVIELMNENTLVLNDCYYCLSSALDLAYYNLPCQRVVKAGEYDSNDLDLEVNPETLHHLLDSLITIA